MRMITENFIEYDGLCREIYDIGNEYVNKEIQNSYYDEYLSINEVSKVIVNNVIVDKSLIEDKNNNSIILHYLLDIKILYVSNYELEKLNEINLQEYYSVLIPLKNISIDNELTRINDYITEMKVLKIDDSTISYYINIIINYKVPS